jgi:beta-1,4-mannosyltransferase
MASTAALADDEELHVAVVVLGDFGRSPRMQYHAASLAALGRGACVHVVAPAGGERCVAAVEAALAAPDGRMDRFDVPAPFARWPRALWPLFAPLKVLHQLLWLTWLLLARVPLPRASSASASAPASASASALSVSLAASAAGAPQRRVLRSAILLQNPPSIPTLLACWVAARLRGARLVVDWHNFGFSILALNLLGPARAAGPGAGGGWPSPSLLLRRLVVAAAREYERVLGARADAHLCVTHAMRAWLAREWALPAARVAVLHDRAPPAFRAAALEEQHELFLRLAPQLPPEGELFDAGAAAGGGRPSATASANAAAAAPAAAAPAAAPARRRRRDSSGGASPAAAGAAAAPGSPSALPSPLAGAPSRTLFTERLADGRVVRRAGRPALLVSSTSWTEDEDFGLLLDALVLLDALASGAGGSLPNFVVVVTGKGPQRAMYEARMAALALRRVRVRTAWLEAADYPLLLGSADLGVCLHASSSGLDLPMKVVDMFGAGLPVCAVGFGCLSELVVDGKNGLVFADAAQLAAQLARLFGGGAGAAGGAELARLRGGVRAFQSLRWHENWLAHAAPIFLGRGGSGAL